MTYTQAQRNLAFTLVIVNILLRVGAPLDGLPDLRGLNYLLKQLDRYPPKVQAYWRKQFGL